MMRGSALEGYQECINKQISGETNDQWLQTALSDKNIQLDDTQKQALLIGAIAEAKIHITDIENAARIAGIFRSQTVSNLWDGITKQTQQELLITCIDTRYTVLSDNPRLHELMTALGITRELESDSNDDECDSFEDEDDYGYSELSSSADYLNSPASSGSSSETDKSNGKSSPTTVIVSTDCFFNSKNKREIEMTTLKTAPKKTQ